MSSLFLFKDLVLVLWPKCLIAIKLLPGISVADTSLKCLQDEIVSKFILENQLRSRLQKTQGHFTAISREKELIHDRAKIWFNASPFEKDT